MNPVVETFSELFEKLKDRSAKDAEKAQPPKISSSLFSTELFEEALQMARFFPGVMVKAPGDTIAYDVNNPATWSNFLPPEFLEAELPATPKRKRKETGRVKDHTKRSWG